ncbi:flavin reductase [Streptomyces anulatus]|uniref:flavin reductase n=1 Tax=Streptomyces anulatus TaxID=1892 RepID=UPI001C26738A|nr:flavin reductase [Streptomyces anulatus]
MSLAVSQPFDPQSFRTVLAHYPTGVAVVTGLAPDGEPVGMVVGSFTSVSLDPPLVAFLPDKKSNSYARLSSARSFCVNVLAADQEDLCRRFASKKAQKFDGVAWRPGPSGAPVLSGAVAWIDCAADQVFEAGDHYIVLGRVTALGVQNPTAPLLFFQGGYGGFTARSLVAPYENDLSAQIRLADLARDHMRALADEFGLECYAQSVVGDEIVVVAAAGPPETAVRTHVGRRLPLVPPYGALFVGGEGERAADQWITRLPRPVSEEDRATCLRMLDQVRRRQWSLGLVSQRHEKVWTEVDGFTAAARTPELDRRMSHVLDEVLDQYEPEELDPDALHDVRVIAAPVHGRDGTVVQVLVLFGMPPQASTSQIARWRERLIAAADAVTETIGGRYPTRAA